MAVLFATVDQIKEFSFIHSNVESSVLTTCIIRAQDTMLQSAIGATFYAHLKDAIDNSTTTTAEDTLINGTLRDYLRVASEIQAITFINWEIRNKSVGTASDEYANPSGWDDLDKLKNNLRKDLQTYKTLMIDFICDNIDDYPLYKNNKDEVSTTDSMSSSFSFVKRRVNE